MAVTKPMANAICNYIKAYNDNNIKIYADSERVYMIDSGYILIAIDRPIVADAIRMCDRKLFGVLDECGDPFAKNIYEKIRYGENFVMFDRSSGEEKVIGKNKKKTIMFSCNKDADKTYPPLYINKSFLGVVDKILNTKRKSVETLYYANTVPGRAMLVINDIGEALIMPIRVR